MEIKDFENAQKIKQFTKQCLLNENFKICRDVCLEVLSNSNTIEEFISKFLDRKECRKYQGYWELVKELGANKLRKMAIDYLEECMKENSLIKRFATASDKGSVKIGNNGFSIGICNKYGDCFDNLVYVIPKECEVGLDFADFVTDIEGTDISIYDYDCGNDVVHKMSGRFGIYSVERLVIFKEWNNF